MTSYMTEGTPSMFKFSKAYLYDLAERVVRTGIQAALAVLVLNWASVTDLDSAKTVGIAAASAAAAAVIGLLTKSIGDPTTPSILPPPPAMEG